MRAPDLTRLLVLEERVDAPDGGGGVTADWTALGAHWADIRPGAAIERTLGGVEASLVTHKVTLRWAPFGAPSRPRANQRFREGDRVFEILGVTEADTRNAWLVAWVRAGALA